MNIVSIGPVMAAQEVMQFASPFGHQYSDSHSSLFTVLCVVPPRLLLYDAYLMLLPSILNL